jgi:hypothetical protein
MPRKSQHCVYEIRRGGLPVVVGVCDRAMLPSAMPGEALHLLLGDVAPIHKQTAIRFARVRLAQICCYATGSATVAPAWLRNRIGVAAVERRHGRRVIRHWPNGQVEEFSTLLSAARAMQRCRAILERRLRDGRADHAGCTWTDVSFAALNRARNGSR